MSSRLYGESFNTAIKLLRKLVKIEMPEVPDLPIMDRHKAIDKTARLYVQYIKIAKKLNMCYDQMLHPQKREILPALLEGSIGRILELKDALVQMELREVQYLDYMLPAFDMEPKDLVLPTPRSFLEEKSDDQTENEVYVQQALKKLEDSKSEAVEGNLSEISSKDDAVLLIQTHERARQDKIHYIEIRQIKARDEQQLKEIPTAADTQKAIEHSISQDEAATRIQSIWRSFMVRRIVNMERREEMKLLKMFIPPPEKQDIRGFQICEKVQQMMQKRRNAQPIYEKSYVDAIAMQREHMQHDIIPDMSEKLEDDIREYFDFYLKENSVFPTYPTEEEGGSFVFLPQEGYEICSEDKEEGKSKKDGKGKKDDKSKKEGKKDDKKKTNPDDDGYILKPSKYLPTVAESLTKYGEWQKQQKIVEEFKDPFQFDPDEYWASLNSDGRNDDTFDKSLIESNLTKEYTLSTRRKVDEKMKVELQLVTAAFNKDLGIKPKKGKGKKGGKKGKKGGKKGKKGKKEKDLTPDRTLESLIEELVEQEILKPYPKLDFGDIFDNYNYCSSFAQKDGDTEPDVSILDIKRVLKEFCIIPMVSSSIHSKGPFTKSLLFAGPAGSGKRTFVHAICNEIGATLFDLTAENIAGKYPGKPGLNMLMHLMLKVGRRLQPTIILIKDAEKTFLKKVPKTDETDPKRLKKDLPKFVKGIKAEDRIMIIGTTCLPFSVDLKGLGKCYQKIIYLRHPDYGFRQTLWFEMITSHKGVITPEFDMSTMSYVSDGYVLPQIKEVVQKVLTERRLAYQETMPLMIKEFTAQLYAHVPLYEEQHEAFKAWLLKMPLGKKRAKMLAAEKEE